MSNERNTENLVREKLRYLGYYEQDNGIRIEEQKSDIVNVKKLLAKASKSGTGNIGYPEFIISCCKRKDFLIVVECKAGVNKHISDSTGMTFNEPQSYAVDGAVHYAKFLSEEYTVVAIGVSGETESEMKVSAYLYPCKSSSQKLLINENGNPVTELLPFDKMYELSAYDTEVTRKRWEDLVEFSKELHELIWTKAKISEEDKPLLVSGTLIALTNKKFREGFQNVEDETSSELEGLEDTYNKKHPAELLQSFWYKTIESIFDKVKMPQGKKESMLQPYSAIAVHPNLGKPDTKLAKTYPHGIFEEIIARIKDNICPFLSVHKDFDIVGQFYGEFLKYTAGDKKALGIVLTPRHITDLFCSLAKIKSKDKVLDICAGTGGFLISAMQNMLKQTNNTTEKDKIKKEQLVGVENNPKMFALAASNMILHGDGKANLHQGSCFDDAIVKAIKEYECNIGLLNPPYAQKKSDSALHELYFVKQMLDCLKEGGTGIAIVPMSCTSTNSKIKEEIMQHHALDAVMSMPDELFSPVGTITCIMVWKAHIPHSKLGRETWFGYWKDDGFIKTKHNGRVEYNGMWYGRKEKGADGKEIEIMGIKDKWLNAYLNRRVLPGESVTRKVDHNDEWCAEAYIETDYSKLTQEDFEKVVKKFLVHRILDSDSEVSENQHRENSDD
jgi:type I restriction-modification system DNA methylase subunit